MKNLKKITAYLGCFLLGIFFAIIALQAYKFFDEYFITGSEVQSQASFPAYHLAKLYSRAGIGDQTFTFIVDGKTVWSSSDSASGNSNEKIIWDETGHIVTLKLNGEMIIIYDALNQKVK